ncbi:hypothetical protein VARIO8X_20067 [Burkholderiales bacterium 8X]|nr:hypothetical protein VARIO8X_20067 [Burkholderiales bacterium 8X]
MRAGDLALRRDPSAAHGVGRSHHRRRGRAPRAGAREPGDTGTLVDHAIDLCRPPAHHAGRGGAFASPRAVGAALHRRRQGCLHHGGRRAHHHASGRLHHHAILGLARPWQRRHRGRDRAGGLARRPRHPDAALLRRRLRRERRFEGAACRAARRPQPGALRPQHGAGAARPRQQYLSDLQLPVCPQPGGAGAAAEAGGARCLARPQAPLHQSADRRLADADHRHAAAAAAGRLCRPIASRHRRHGLQRGRRPRHGAHRQRALRLRSARHLRGAVLGAARARSDGRMRAVQLLGSAGAAGHGHPARALRLIDRPPRTQRFDPRPSVAVPAEQP